ncbi:S8 family serine peptidase [Herbaspirillum sp. GCM10030257]|uniref:S8 family peptidase n=1 Tax=Herbaspirillum sp. GCM10030257 TaxID=3273393 RepID=UPI00360F5BF9
MSSPVLLVPRFMSLAVCSACAALAMPASADPVEMMSGAAVQTTRSALETERSNSAYIGRIRADYAYRLGITGKGVTIATLDTGISPDHREFSRTGRLLRGFNAVNGSSDVTDRSGHGSHTTGIIAAARDGRGISGVAYDATLLPIKVFPDRGSGSTAALDIGLRYAIGKASIVNMSLGASSVYDSRAMQQAVKGGLLIVASAGNDGSPSVGWPARFAREAWANNQIIAVGAVDASNKMASFSNRAGDVAAWYLVASGVSIYSSYRNDQYATMSGTSMAAPLVSGAAALLMQMWPSLRADQVATILLVTATDLGAPGIDPIYGRGLLNVEKAMQPIGMLTTTTFNGKRVSVLAGLTQPSSATSKIWSLATSGQLRVVGRDDFERDFGIDLGATVARPTSLSLDRAIGDMDRRIEVAEKVLADGSELSLAYENRRQQMGLSFADAPRRRLAALSLQRQASSGMETAFALGGYAGAYFGAAALKPSSSMSLAEISALSNPYLSLLPATSHAGFAQEFHGVKLKFGVIDGGSDNLLVASPDIYLPSSVMPRAKAGVFELSKSFDGAAVSFSMSQTRESNAYLGSYSSGMLGLANRASTNSVQLAGALMLTPNLALAGQAAYGITPGGRIVDSLITEVTATRTNAFSLALVGADRFREGDRVSISVAQPMRTYAGSLALDVLAANQAREHTVFSMVPTGRETRAELNYRSPAGRLATVGMMFMLRRDPNNIADAPMDKLAALRYTARF